MEYYINLQLPDPEKIDQIPDIMANLKNELDNEGYSDELKSIIAFSLFKNQARYEVSDYFYKDMIEKTGVFSLALLADELKKLHNKENNQENSLEIIKKLITVVEKNYTNIEKDAHDTLFLESYVNNQDILSLHLSSEELKLLEEIGCTTNKYFDVMKKIIIHKGAWEKMRETVDPTVSAIIVDLQKLYGEKVQLEQHEIEKRMKILTKYYAIHNNELLLKDSEVVSIFNLTKNWDPESQEIVQNMLKNSYKKYLETEKSENVAHNSVTLEGYTNTLLESRKNNIKHRVFFEDLIYITAAKFFDLTLPFCKKYVVAHYISGYFEKIPYDADTIIDMAIVKFLACCENDVVLLVRVLKEISSGKGENNKILIEKLSQKIVNLEENIQDTGEIIEIIENIDQIIKNIETYDYALTLFRRFIFRYFEKCEFKSLISSRMIPLSNNNHQSDTELSFIDNLIDRLFLDKFYNSTEQKKYIIHEAIERYITNRHINLFIQEMHLSNQQIFDICCQLLKHKNKALLEPVIIKFSQKLNGFFNITKLRSAAKVTHNQEIVDICEKKLAWRVGPPILLLACLIWDLIDKKYHLKEKLLKSTNNRYLKIILFLHLIVVAPTLLQKKYIKERYFKLSRNNF